MTKTHFNLPYKLLVTSYSISSFSEGILLPIYAIFVQKVGGDILDAGWAMGIFLITEGLFTIIFHRVKRAKEKCVFWLIVGWGIWFLGIISYLIISNIWMLFLTQIITAIGNAIADPLVEEEISICNSGVCKETGWGFFEGSKAFADGAAAIIGSLIATYFGFNVLIYTMIGMASVSMLIILFYPTRLRSTL